MSEETQLVKEQPCKRKGLNNALTIGAVVLALATGYIWRGTQVTAQTGNVPAPHATQEPVVKSKGTEEAVAMQSAFGAVAKTVEPAVVTITTRQRRQTPPNQPPGTPGAPGAPDPFEEFFRRFRDFGFRGNSYSPAEKEEMRQAFYSAQEVQARRGGGLGSGMIYDESGFILTNAHVVQGADTVDVKLNDGRELKGTVVGRDQRTDVAVVKVNASKLPTVKFGDSSKVNVGDWAIALGNPFGLEHTVTVGVISATAREVPLNQRSPGDYLQTDASINPGNSGGPLCDIYGRVIGVNNAIFSESGGNIGIGFAIPINTAADIAMRLAKEGKIRRGYLGVRISDMDSNKAAAFGIDPKTKGVLIEDVTPNTPGARAGLQPGDVVTAFNNQPVARSAELQRLVGNAKVGSTAALKVLRGGEEITVNARLDELKEEGEGASSPLPTPDPEPASGATASPTLGLKLSPVTPQLKQSFGLKTDQGLVIVSVDRDSPAAQAGLQPGDVIERVAQTNVTSAQQLQAAVNKILESQTSEEKNVALYIDSRGERRFVVVTITK